MKSISEAWCIQIEVNNYCPHSCAYCTRFTKHMRADQRYNMDHKDLRYILKTMTAKGYEGKLGIIGGEPTIHPEFRLIMNVIWNYWTRPDLGRWLALWTSGGKKYDELMRGGKKKTLDSFSWIAFNDKSDPKCHHQPMTMASQDVVPDPEFRAELIDQCWVQRIWCPSITPKGVFFCECAAAWDRLLDGPGGWPLESDWLNYGPEDYESQKWACQLCGMCVPMPAQGMDSKERVSASVMKEFIDHDVALRSPEDVDLDSDFVDRKIYEQRHPDWAPGEYTPGRAKGGVE